MLCVNRINFNISEPRTREINTVSGLWIIQSGCFIFRSEYSGFWEWNATGYCHMSVRNSSAIFKTGNGESGNPGIGESGNPGIGESGNRGILPAAVHTRWPMPIFKTGNPPCGAY